MTRRGERAQASVETMLLIAIGVTALVMMLIYVQRGIQGNFYAGSSSLGLQFDPRDAWNENENMNSTDTVIQRPRAGAIGANLLHGNLAAPNTSLRDLATGPVHREPSVQDSAVTSSWSSNSNANYAGNR